RTTDSRSLVQEWSGLAAVFGAGQYLPGTAVLYDRIILEIYGATLQSCAGQDRAQHSANREMPKVWCGHDTKTSHGWPCCDIRSSPLVLFAVQLLAMAKLWLGVRTANEEADGIERIESDLAALELQALSTTRKTSV